MCLFDVVSASKHKELAASGYELTSARQDGAEWDVGCQRSGCPGITERLSIVSPSTHVKCCNGVSGSTPLHFRHD